MYHVPSYVYMIHFFLDHHITLGCISVPLLSHYFNRACHSVFQRVFCTFVIAVKVDCICFIVLGWKHLKYFFARICYLGFCLHVTLLFICVVEWVYG